MFTFTFNNGNLILLWYLIADVLLAYLFVPSCIQGTKSCVLVSHSACIWDVKNLSCEYMHNPSLACAARGCPGGASFTTCSADGTIRLWDLVLQPGLSEGCSSKINDCSLAITEPVDATCLGNACLRYYHMC